MTLKELNNEEIKQFTKIKDINEKTIYFPISTEDSKIQQFKITTAFISKIKNIFDTKFSNKKNNEVCNTQILEWNERL